MEVDYLAKLRRFLALAQSGLAYAKDPFDQERYQEIKDQTLAMISELTKVPLKTLTGAIGQDEGYATPKSEVRALITKGEKVLLVQDHLNHLWSLPGGFADVGYSPSENVAKEVLEETGLTVKVQGLLAVYDTAKRPDIPQIAQFYKMIFRCDPLAGHFKQNSETDQAKYFSLNDLPPLSLERTTVEQLHHVMADSITPLVIE